LNIGQSNKQKMQANQVKLLGGIMFSKKKIGMNVVVHFDDERLFKPVSFRTMLTSEQVGKSEFVLSKHSIKGDGMIDMFVRFEDEKGNELAKGYIWVKTASNPGDHFARFHSGDGKEALFRLW
jgi:hypothetical protein